MRKTNIALLVAVVVSSPIALAGWNSHPAPAPDPVAADNDITVTDSFNDKVVYDKDIDLDKNLTVTDSFNSDDDKLIMHDVNNDESFKYTDNSDNSQRWENNSVNDYSKDLDFDMETNVFIADSYLDGEVTYSSVNYGGACCGYQYSKGHHGDQAPSTLTVTQGNDMTGAFGGASGINLAGQNAGNNSLVQQSASTNAVLAD